MTPEFNLLILHTPDRQDIADWMQVATTIQEQAPDIEVRIASNFARGSVTRRWQGRRPSLVFSPYKLANYEPAGGRVYCGLGISKLEQIARFQKAGVRTPRTAELTRQDPAPGSGWPDQLIIKPMRGFYGEGVQLVRADELKTRAGELLIGPEPWLLQEFIDTGEQPYQYRVLTLFGRALYAITLHAAPVSNSDHPLAPGGKYRLASNIAQTARSSAERDVIDFARQMHRAIPEVPVLGADILRDRKTGELYALEANPGGNIWHLSSPAGKKLQEATGLNLYEQFGALAIVADELIRRTRSEATF